MFEKVWDAHEVADGLLYIDLHLVHEVTSAQAFEGLRMAGRRVRRPDRTLAERRVPTGPGEPDELSRLQLEALERNCREFGVPLYALGHRRQGIVHRDVDLKKLLDHRREPGCGLVRGTVGRRLARRAA